MSNVFIGINEKAQEINSIFIGDENNKAQEVNQLYYGVNNKALEIPLSKTILPRDYQQVEYIESTGKQYIILDENNKSSTPFDITLIWSYTDVFSTSRNWILGTQHESQYYGLGNETTTLLFCYYSYSSLISTSLFSIEENYKYNFLLHLDKSNQTLTINGKSIFKNAFSRGLSIPIGYLFTRGENKSPNTTSMAVGRLYSYKLTLNNIKKYDLYPCYRKRDNMAGLYDIINGIFFEEKNLIEEEPIEHFIVGPKYEEKL